MRYILICCALFFCISAYAQKDTLYFSNGSVVVGKLKKVKLGIVTFDPDDVAIITVQLRKIKTISAEREVFRVETINNELYFGRILKSPEGTMRLGRYSDTLRFSLQEISILYPVETHITQRFTGTAGLGYSYTRSSGLGRLNFDATVNYVAPKDEVSLSVSGIYTVYDSLFSRDKEGANLKYNYYFTKQWFGTLFVGYQRNLELGLQRRYQQGIGIGNKLIRRKKVYGWARGGFTINQERSTEGVESGVLSEGFGQFEMNIYKFEKPKVTVLFQQTFYYSISQSGRFRNDGSLNVLWELFKDFNLSFEPYNNFDSQPPGTDSHKLDFGIVFGIKYIF